MTQTMYDLVWNQADRTPDAVAMMDDITDRQLTYRELVDELDAIAAGFAARGIGVGDRVGTCLSNVWEHGLAVLALTRLGAVPALINPRLKPDDVAKLIELAEMKAAVLMPDPALAEAVSNILPEGAPVFTAGAAAGPAEDFAVCRADPSGLPKPEPGREDPAIIFYTSGTTGLPKAVVLAHRTTEPRIMWLATQGSVLHGPHTRAVGFMPLAHAIGFYGVFLVTLAFGGMYQAVSNFDPAAVVDLIEDRQLTYAFAAPTLYYALSKAPNYDPAKMRSMELVLYGGSTIREDLIAHMAETWENVTIRHIYGTTETMCSAYNPDPIKDGKLDHVALRPGYFTRLRVIKMGGEPDDVVGPGEEGELLVAANEDTIFTEYLGRPDATAEKKRDGWVWIGDVVTLDERGYFTLSGRVDDMIKSGGENIHPADVESVLLSHPQVEDGTVIGLPDEQWGQIVVGCVVSDDPPSAAELDAHFKASPLAGFMRPKGYFFCDEVPRNPGNGNVLRRLLREAAQPAREGGDGGWQAIG
jgi:acyl-CoA synthetase (AMP-forming)/AMP-acid ligase II